MGEFPIRVLAELTGVPPTTLRAWERRYGLLKPERTPKGHRIYRSKDLQTVRRIVSLLESGQTVGNAVKQLREGKVQRPDRNTDASPWSTFRRRLLRAIEGFDELKLDAIYNEALALYPIDLVTVNLLHPLLEQLGGRWCERETGVAEEHFFTAYLRNKLGARLHHSAGHNRGKCLLLACLPGERHELGALLFALSGMARGYRFLYLGPDLPLSQVAPITAKVELAAVLLSGTCEALTEELSRELASLAESLPVPLMLGGKMTEGRDDVLRSLGVLSLGAVTPVALERLESTVPPYGSL